MNVFFLTETRKRYIRGVEESTILQKKWSLETFEQCHLEKTYCRWGCIIVTVAISVATPFSNKIYGDIVPRISLGRRFC
jgi:hypothetical protein